MMVYEVISFMMLQDDDTEVSRCHNGGESEESRVDITKSPKQVSVAPQKETNILQRNFKKTPYLPKSIRTKITQRGKNGARNGRNPERKYQENPIVTTKSYLTVQHNHQKRCRRK